MTGRVWVQDGAAYLLCLDRAEQAHTNEGPAPGDAVIKTDTALAGNRSEWIANPWLVLNAGLPAFMEERDGAWKKRLERAGVAVSRDAGLEQVRQYKVAFFHLHALSVEKLLPDQSHRVLVDAASTFTPMQEEDARYRPLVRLAARALYACGLDNGTVVLAENRQGRSSVTGIGVPSAADYKQEPWVSGIRQLARELRPSRKPAAAGAVSEPAVMLGADPEFLLLAENGKVVSAARYLEGGHGAGCDAVFIGGQIQYPVAELRPAPSDSPSGLAGNIRLLLKDAAQRIPSQPPLRWAAGGMPAAGFALGGHIHVSGVPLTGRLLRQLDSYVAFPLAMIESPSDGARRPRYGFLGDFRLQPHGGFEYRTLPSWLVSPAAAKAAFALTLLCAKESERLAYLPSTEERFVEAYYAGDRTGLRACFDDIAGAIAGTVSYAELARWIEPLFAAIRAGKTWDTEADFRIKWRVSTVG
ncbi:hypothetical protein [Paenibacillus sp. R14(2021)]|uniref:putative amidoligase domain-containing protein n=1 Tax=Paenibacillus sp. R14(2021) TaxID=2859228 RepID=UPI001C615879|nr:hypothetical protein [Paenibacillus sp. R14(2021)]